MALWPKKSEHDTKSIGLITMAVWFGLLTSLSQIVLRGILSLWLDRKVFYSLHVVWMAPLADATFFALVGAILWVVLRPFSQTRRIQIGAGVLAFLVVYSAYLLYPRVHWIAFVVLGAGVGIQVGRLIGAHLAFFTRIMRRSLVAMVALVVVMAAVVVGRSRWTESRTLARMPEPPAGSPNVLLLILDTVRAASLSLYGYDRETTPEISKLSAHAIVFDQAYSPAPWTLPSHSSMFTGYPAHELSANWRTPLDSKYPTLAEVLRDRGYNTGGFVANMLYGTFEYGLNRGFVHYEDVPISLESIAKSSLLTRMATIRVRWNLLHNGRPLARKTAADVNKEFLRWEAHQKNRPYFAFLNYLDAHSPYLPPNPWPSKFGPKKTQLELDLDTANWTPAQIQMEIDAYDAGIAYLDSQIGRLMSELERRGSLRNTIVILTSDHGEQMGEHNLLYHSNNLYLEQLHVPLLVKLPNSDKPLRVANPVTLTDLAATVTDLTGLRGGYRFPGNSLAFNWDTSIPAPAARTPMLASVRKAISMPGWLPVSKGDMSSLIANGFQLIRGGDGKEELYNLTVDPREARNLVSDTSSVAVQEAMRRSLDQAMSGNKLTHR